MKRALALAALVCGCHGPRTEMVVRVAQSGLAIPDDADQLAMFIRDQTTGDKVYSVPPTPLCGSGTCVGLPTAITLFPGPMGPHHLVEVEVQALKNGTSVIDDAASFTFADGRDQEMEFVLYKSCLHTNCAANASMRACVAGGVCGDIPVEPLGSDLGVPSEDLAPAQDLAPNQDLRAPDLAVPDGAVDQSMPPPPDQSVPDDLAHSGDLSTLPDLSPIDLDTIPLPQFDDSGNVAFNNVGSLTWSHTVGSALPNTMLIVGVCVIGSTTVNSVTYDGIAMSPLVISTTNGTQEVGLYYLPNPPPGTSDVMVSLISGSGGMAGGSISLYNVDQIHQPSPSAAPGTSANPQLSVSGAAGDLVVDAMCSDGLATPFSPGSGQSAKAIAIGSPTGTNSAAIGMSILRATGGTTTMQWSLASTRKWQYALGSFTHP